MNRKKIVFFSFAAASLIALSLPARALAESEFSRWQSKALSAEKTGDKIIYYENAIRAWTQADTQQALSFTYTMLASEYLSSNRLDQVIDAAGKAIKAGNSEGGLPYNLRATAYGIRHRYEKAEADLLAGLSLLPKSGPTRRNLYRSINMNLCMNYYSLEDYDKALDACNSGIASAPAASGSDYLKRAQVYLELGRFGEASADIEKADRLLSDSIKARNVQNVNTSFRSYVYLARGYAAFKKGEMQSALKEYDAGIRKSPGTAELYWQRGRAHAAAGAADAALRDYSRALRLDPYCVNAHAWKGYLHYQRRDYKTALKEFNSALAISRIPSVIMHRGLCYVKMGRFQAAITDLDMYISKKTGEAEAYYARGQSYEGLGNAEFAGDDFATACRLGYKPACRR